MNQSWVGRLIALVLAAGLVVGALAWRNGWSFSSDGSVSTNGATPRLVCVTELADVCNKLPSTGKDRVEVTIEQASVTLGRLTAATSLDNANMDGWLAPKVWIDAARDARQRAGSAELPGSSNVIARSPLSLTAENARLNVLKGACGGSLTWKCIGDAMGKHQWTALPNGNSQWGTMKVGWSDPGATAEGLVTLGAETTGFFGRTDVDNLDIDGNDFSIWITGATQSVSRSSTSDPLTTMLTAGPAAYGWVVGTEAHSAALLQQAARKSEFQTVRPTPVATFDVSFSAIGSQRSLAKRVGSEAMKKAFTDAQWVVAGKPAPSVASKDPITDTDNLPSSGALSHLRTKWLEELSK